MPRLPELRLRLGLREALSLLSEPQINFSQQDEPLDHVIERDAVREGPDYLDNVFFRLDGRHNRRAFKQNADENSEFAAPVLVTKKVRFARLTNIAAGGLRGGVDKVVQTALREGGVQPLVLRAPLAPRSSALCDRPRGPAPWRQPGRGRLNELPYQNATRGTNWLRPRHCSRHRAAASRPSQVPESAADAPAGEGKRLVHCPLCLRLVGHLLTPGSIADRRLWSTRTDALRESALELMTGLHERQHRFF